jgi:hypothetical protein
MKLEQQTQNANYLGWFFSVFCRGYGLVCQWCSQSIAEQEKFRSACRPRPMLTAPVFFNILMPFPYNWRLFSGFGETIMGIDQTFRYRGEELDRGEL